jgi:hypothetical protein
MRSVAAERNADGAGRILLVGMPLLYLIEAAQICAVSGTAVLPAGAAGDLADTAPGTEVLFVATQAGEHEIPAATWGARFVGTVTAGPDEYPEGLPPGWLEARLHPRAAPTSIQRSAFGDQDIEEPTDDVGEQSYFEVEAFAELPNASWIFVNELVPKQVRQGRTYFPRAPRLVERPM